MIKNKAIILAPLLFAWTVIFAHSILPHNHHNESESECKHSHSSDSHDQHTVVFLKHHHSSETHDHCHFNINTTLAKFIDISDIYFIANFSIIQTANKLITNRFNYLILTPDGIFQKIVSLRGPPAIC